PAPVLVGETDQGEAILRPQLVHEVADRLLRRVELAALPHASGHVEEERDRDGLVALDREVLDLLRDALVEELEILRGQAGNEPAFAIFDARREQDESYGDLLLLLDLEDPLDGRVIELLLAGRRWLWRVRRRGRGHD